jgi:putative transcriptional regulator
MLGNRQDSGSPIGALRRRLKMTQEEFAHAIGVTVSTVNRWENGHIEPSRLARKAMETLLSESPGSSEFTPEPMPLSAKES